MSKINAGRVVLGGLLAGVVVNIFEYTLNGVLLAEDWANAMKALNKEMVESASTIAIYLLWGFLIGILSIWLYAAIRPRFGAGAGTAVKAGILMWLLVYLQWVITMLTSGLFPTRLLLIATASGLVELVLATVLGAWIYKEEATA